MNSYWNDIIMSLRKNLHYVSVSELAFGRPADSAGRLWSGSRSDPVPRKRRELRGSRGETINGRIDATLDKSESGLTNNPLSLASDAEPDRLEFSGFTSPDHFHRVLNRITPHFETRNLPGGSDLCNCIRSPFYDGQLRRRRRAPLPLPARKPREEPDAPSAQAGQPDEPRPQGKGPAAAAEFSFRYPNRNSCDCDPPPRRPPESLPVLVPRKKKGKFNRIQATD